MSQFLQLRAQQVQQAGPHLQHTNPLALARLQSMQRRQEQEPAPRPSTSGSANSSRGPSQPPAAALEGAASGRSSARSSPQRAAALQLLSQGRSDRGGSPTAAFHTAFTNPLAVQEAEEDAAAEQSPFQRAAVPAPPALPQRAAAPAAGSLSTATSLQLPGQHGQGAALSPRSPGRPPQLPSPSQQRQGSSPAGRARSSPPPHGAAPGLASPFAHAAEGGEALDAFLSERGPVGAFPGAASGPHRSPGGSPVPGRRGPPAVGPSAMPWDSVSKFEGAADAAPAAAQQAGSPAPARPPASPVGRRGPPPSPAGSRAAGGEAGADKRAALP